MQKSTDGVGRQPAIARSARRLSQMSGIHRVRATLLAALGPRPGRTPVAPVGRLSAALASAVRPFATAERALPIIVAALVAVASLLTLLPSSPAGSVGAAQGSATSPRLAINGGVRSIDVSAEPGGLAAVGLQTEVPSFQPLTLPAAAALPAPSDAPAQSPGVVTPDGTLVTGYAPDTTVEDGSALIQMYRVKKGDTVSGIAAQFHVSSMTIWWANKSAMTAITDLHVGQLLKVPPANGLIITVGASDTLASIAAKYKVAAQSILDLNQLTDPTLVVGQVLILPGAKGAPIPTPKPVVTKVASATTRSSGSSSSTRQSSGTVARGISGSYSGGRLSWPVIGGNNYISQYYHYGHWAIDIAADYGSTVVAAAPGQVIFAGWKSNGGGWQVWISHGGDMYTTYNHMSAITVGTGESVRRGEQVGRIGQSGDATGPHLHFEVWIGPIWAGGQRMNPLNYL